MSKMKVLKKHHCYEIFNFQVNYVWLTLKYFQKRRLKERFNFITCSYNADDDSTGDINKSFINDITSINT